MSIFKKWQVLLVGTAMIIGATFLARAQMTPKTPSATPTSASTTPEPPTASASASASTPIAAPGQTAQSKKAVFAGGCFWSMSSAFEKVKGVSDVVSGYIGGKGEHPTYENYEEQGFVEAVQLTYDPAAITYQELIDEYFHHTDPSDGGGAFVDRGPQYRPVIYVGDALEKRQAEVAKDRLNKSGFFDKPIAVEISTLTPFYAAEDYHQHYAKKNPAAYGAYRTGSGRDAFFAHIWDPARIKAILKKHLTPIQYDVTQQDGTEAPFQNPYFNNEKPGIYVDLISNEPLFSSKEKFESGTGWPSFFQPLEAKNVVTKTDSTLGETRTEVRGARSNSHLGHVFDDGPAPTHLRYCMDSAALRFIAKEDLEKEGFGQYVKLFQ